MKHNYWPPGKHPPDNDKAPRRGNVEGAFDLVNCLTIESLPQTYGQSQPWVHYPLNCTKKPPPKHPTTASRLAELNRQLDAIVAGSPTQACRPEPSPVGPAPATGRQITAPRRRAKQGGVKMTTKKMPDAGGVGIGQNEKNLVGLNPHCTTNPPPIQFPYTTD